MTPAQKLEFLEILKKIEDNECGFSLDLSRDKLGYLIEEDAVKLLTEALKKNNTLTSLELYHQNIGSTCLSKNDRYESFGPKYLAEVLKSNNTLVYVGLGRNHIGIEGIGYLQCAIEENKSLTKVDLRENPFNKKGYCGAKLGDERKAAIDNHLIRNQVNNSDLIIGSNVEASSNITMTLQFTIHTSNNQNKVNEVQTSKLELKK